MSEAAFTRAQVERYSRQILLAEIGVAGQRRLRAASALVVGAGGLGSPALQYLTAAGVGRLGIVDDDRVELSNLQRQVVHRTADLGRLKAERAAEFVRELNPDCAVEVIAGRLTAHNVASVVADYDVVLDGSDNFPTRFLVADACWWAGVPLVSGAVTRFEGQLMTVLPGPGSPCYRCFIAEPPPPGIVPSCREAGVLGAVAGVIGALQAVEALRLLAGLEQPMSHDVLLYEGLAGCFEKVARSVDPHCALCSSQPTITEPIEYEVGCEVGGEPGESAQRRAGRCRLTDTSRMPPRR